MGFILQWVLSAASLTILSKFLPGFHLKNFGTAMAVAGVYGILHTLLFWFFAIIAFIPRFLTFGLVDLVFNACILFATNKLLEDFEIDSLAITCVGAVSLTILNNIWAWLLF
ncbi:MAG: phage holin family protein [bacterium]|nr:phage holin family protein [bacterium]